MQFNARFAALCVCVLTSVLLPLSSASAWQAQPVTIEIECARDIPNVSFQVSSAYSVNNAFMAALASYVVEKQNKPAIEHQLAAWGFQNIKVFGKPKYGVYAYIVEGDGFRLLAFRGTTSIEEAFQDSLFRQVSYQQIGLEGHGHWGMMRHYQKLVALVMPDLMERIKNDPKPLILTGHSLGGALALIHGMRMRLMGLDVTAIYTSGQPRIGDDSFYAQAETLVGDRYYRLEHRDDMTPRLPPSRDIAEEFSRIVPWDDGILQRGIAGLIWHMSYHRPNTLTMSLDEHRIEPIEDGKSNDAKFWGSLDGALQGIKSFGQLIMTLNSRMIEHPGRRYVCNFAKILKTFGDGQGEGGR